MTGLSFSEWAAGRQDVSYARHIASPPQVVSVSMIKVAEGERFLGPLFEGGFGLARVSDQRGYPRLPVETVVYADFVDREARAAVTIGRDLIKAAGADTRRDYLTGRYRKKTFEPVDIGDTKDTVHFAVPDVMPGSATLDHPFLRRDVYASATLDGMELVDLFASLVENVPKERLLPMVKDWQRRAKERAERFLVNDMPACATIERPYLLTFMGADDFSYGRAYRSLAEAEEAIKEIEASPTEETVSRLLVFTN